MWPKLVTLQALMIIMRYIWVLYMQALHDWEGNLCLKSGIQTPGSASIHSPFFILWQNYNSQLSPCVTIILCHVTRRFTFVCRVSLMLYLITLVQTNSLLFHLNFWLIPKSTPLLLMADYLLPLLLRDRYTVRHTHTHTCNYQVLCVVYI